MTVMRNPAKLHYYPEDVSLTNSPTDSSYQVTELGIANNTFMFSYLGTFLSYITPQDPHVVYCLLELLRDAFRAQVSLSHLIFEALKIESGFICLMSLFIVISVLPLGITMVWCCCVARTRKSANHHQATEDASADDSMNIQESLEEHLKCQQKTLSFFLQTLLFLWAVAILFMFITNEQIALAIDKTPNVIRVSLKDAELFVKDTYRHISGNLNGPINALVDEVTTDVSDIDKLLGEPIRQELAQSTNLETIFDNIVSLCSVNSELEHRLEAIYKTLGMTLQTSREAATRIAELQIQLSFIQRNCISGDRPLCDTLRLKAFEEFGIVEVLVRIQKDEALQELYELINRTNNNFYLNYAVSEWQNVSLEVEEAKKRFHGIPQLIKNRTAKERDTLMAHLVGFGARSDDAVHDMGVMSRGVVDKIDLLWGHVVPYFENINGVTSTLWGVGLGLSLISLCTVMIFGGGLGCGCWEYQHKAGITLLIGCAFLGILSVALALFAIAVMLLGGHGALFLCRPLYDSPNFFILRRLIDKPGIIFQNESSHGLVNDLFISKLKYPNTTLDVSLDQIINECGRNASTFTVFQLEKLLSIHTVDNLENAFDLSDLVRSISGQSSQLSTLTDPLQQLLENILSQSALNFTNYRLELSQQMPERELANFSDQLLRVSIQIKDVATVSRMITLATRIRRLQITALHQLEQHKGDLIYLLTALELQLNSYDHTIVGILERLDFVKRFINESASEIFEEHAKKFENRCLSRIEKDFQAITLALKASNKLGSCHPLYDIFDTNRKLFCRHILHPLNGLWFSTFCCILLFTIITPVSLSLAEVYEELGRIRKQMRNTGSHQAPSESIIIGEQSNWSSASG